MTDREKIIKGLEIHLKELNVGKTCFECPYRGDNPCEIMLIANALELLKEHESRINEIAEYKQSVSGSGMHELDDYEKGKLDGLQIAWNIISEGR